MLKTREYIAVLTAMKTAGLALSLARSFSEDQLQACCDRLNAAELSVGSCREYGKLQSTLVENPGSIEHIRQLFDAAEKDKGEHQSDLIPFWCFGKDQEVKIERLLSFYPMSRDENNYAHLIKILNYYRLTLGQPRQEELLEYVFSEIRDADKLKSLFINLSPFDKEHGM